MSALTLTLRSLPIGRLDLAPLSALLDAGDPAALANLRLDIGTRHLPLAELFSVEGDDPHDVVLKGDLARVDGIGAGLQTGRIRVDGPVGAYLGLELAGGTLEVHGDAGHCAAVGMRRGRITIHGHAGDHLGGALPGAMKGMAGGQVVVFGNAGARCGDRMRRGAILVSGQIGDYAGSRMLAGTVLSLGGVGKHAGYGMRRGTLLVGGPLALDATFADCGRHTLPIVNLLFRSWSTLGGAFGALAGGPRPVQRHLGDRAADGKGEVLQFN